MSWEGQIRGRGAMTGTNATSRSLEQFQYHTLVFMEKNSHRGKILTFPLTREPKRPTQRTRASSNTKTARLGFLNIPNAPCIVVCR